MRDFVSTANLGVTRVGPIQSQAIFALVSVAAPIKLALTRCLRELLVNRNAQQSGSARTSQQSCCPVHQLSKDTREKMRDRVCEDRGDLIVENEEGSAALPISNRDRAMYVGLLSSTGCWF